jgi:acetyl esterase/lipase
VPAVVWVHGGGFAVGSRHDEGWVGSGLAERGVAVAVIDYRLSDGNWFPTTTLTDPDLDRAAVLARDDAQAAVRWLVSVAARYGIDPSRVSIAGYSAGGITSVETDTHAPSLVHRAVSVSGAGIDLLAFSARTPPLLMLHGSSDAVIPVSLARATCGAAQRSGSTCTLTEFPGVGHDLPVTHTTTVLDDLARFVSS